MDNKDQHLLFDNYLTGPTRANGPAGQFHEYPIPTPGEPFHFRYGERTINARQARRVIHPNERANVMSPSNGGPRNDPKQTRGVVRVAQMKGRPQGIAVVGVLDHPPGESQRL
ncbi:hypothetical protein CMUS01_07304 [Colletotrichum musicola]|uniref:Uncharacterized protein n=1 Tax=Colletotrichum musicola TaxID=2175873 RepID=A0A8H6KHY0_9PEZI|nr:hypothetical protein CMUS01_07304 [Colletotrichum musicola]